MKPRYQIDHRAAIVYDAGQLDHVESAYFEPSYWEARGAVVGQAKGGRGSALFVQQGSEYWALRHYRRGGLVARLVTDHYLWLGLRRTRAWREWHITADLYHRGFPVPLPVAARVLRSGLIYSADLITRRLPHVEQLTQRLQTAALPADGWKRLGGLLRRFHAIGLDHADLNADNILLSVSNEFWLIDFDQARLRAAGGWQKNNLLRLKRSLIKRRGRLERFYWTENDWLALCAGYDTQAGG